MSAGVDAIVLGLGGMGSAAAAALAGRGARVVGLETHAPAHDRGSSHGETRIVRKAYFEHPDYVPLLRRAYEGWDALEAEVGRRIFFRTGLVLSGPPEGAIVAGVRRAAKEHALDIEDLERDVAAARFAPMAFAPGAAVLFERDAGYVKVEDAVLANLELARRRGADLRFGVAARSWSVDAGNGTVAVETDGGTLRADRLVVCAGPWASEVLADLRLPLVVRRKVMLWLRCEEPRYAACPVFGFQEDGAFFYGFPAMEPGRVKLAEHTGGESTSPDGVDRSLRATDVTRVADFAARRLPGVASDVLRHAVCLYTMTPDEHFVIDRHPQAPGVVLAAGFSGHGFKLAPLVGSVLADLALDGATREPIGLFRIARLA